MAEQSRQDWQDARVGLATASRFGDVMSFTKSGESAARKNYRAELVAERLTGQATEGYTSQAMQWGIDTEPTAKLLYSLRNYKIIEDCDFIPHSQLMAGASPDGKIKDENAGVEIKCPNTATHIETMRNRKVPSQYYWQIQGQMWMTGWDYIDFVSCDPRLPEGAQLVVIRVERDKDKIAELEAEVSNFLQTVSDEVDFVRQQMEDRIEDRKAHSEDRTKEDRSG